MVGCGHYLYIQTDFKTPPMPIPHHSPFTTIPHSSLTAHPSLPSHTHPSLLILHYHPTLTPHCSFPQSSLIAHPSHTHPSLLIVHYHPTIIPHHSPITTIPHSLTAHPSLPSHTHPSLLTPHWHNFKCNRQVKY